MVFRYPTFAPDILKHTTMFGRKTTKLDNAALIYTSSLSDNYANKFRVSVTLAKDVDRDSLNDALAITIKRFPSFRYKLGRGLFWCHFTSIKQAPKVSDSCELDPLPIKDSSGYLFKITCDGPTVNMDVFHSLADGTAAMTFLMTLAAEYLRLHDGVEVNSNNWILDTTEEASEEECSDAFESFSSGKGELEKGTPAYHVHGSEVSDEVLHNMKVTIPTSMLKEEARKNHCTVTDLLTAIMIRSIQRIRKEDRSRSKRSSIKVCVPVNLRKIYKKNTMRNFSSYVNLGVDVGTSDKDLSDIVKCVSTQKKMLTNPKCLEPKINANVSLEKNPFIRMIPWNIKKIAMQIIHRLKGDRLCSQTLSNLGQIELPDSMKRHVKGINFQLGKHLYNFGACGCVSYGGITTLNFSRKIRETKFEQYFLEELRSLGIRTA